MSATPIDLATLIESREARVGIVGLGAVGLPLAAIFTRAGFRVRGFDKDPARLETIAHGRSPLRHVPREVVLSMIHSGRFKGCAGGESMAEVDVLLVCVPTPLNAKREPDLSAVEEVARRAAPELRRGSLLVLESTTYPGTTRDVIGGILADFGREPGSDIHLAFSPERQDPGRGDPTDTGVPKLVGGVDERSTALAHALYAAVFDEVHQVSSSEVAEAAKIYENVFRAVNIALVNELKVTFAAMDVDIWEVIEAAATKPFGFMKFTPGPGMGGHCIPVDPFYLSWVARCVGAETRFVELAGVVNREMPSYVVTRTARALEGREAGLDGARILLLGIAYKPEVDIVSESPALRLFELFEEAGADVEYSDPYVLHGPREGVVDMSHLRSIDLHAESLAAFDAVVVATQHAAFDWELIAAHARVVIDTRNALAGRMDGDARYHRA